ncbi:MAG: anti-sigma factor antagonist [Chitinophagales bacterium]|nr:MAG: anti-sigma factor antagonist [Chitinophagales bacterium]
MECIIKSEGEATVIGLKGSLLADIQAKEVLDKISALIQEGKVHFIIDLSQLKFINSSGLGMLLTCLLKARKNGGEMVLIQVPEQVSNLLHITKLAPVFKIAETAEEARTMLKS